MTSKAPKPQQKEWGERGEREGEMSSEEEAAAELHWFAKWEEDLPSPEELMPLSQSLITPGLATAFDIPTTATATANNNQDNPSNANPSSATKKPRLVWTPQLHKRFVDAISQLAGIKNAVPKTIMQLMNVEGLTRENVASHLQKYRSYLKRVQMQSAASVSSSSASAFIVDAATDRLFATAPVPRQFLKGASVPVAAVQQHYRPIAAAAGQQNQYYQQRHVGLMMREYPQMIAMKQPMQNPYVQYLASGREDGRRALNLFPTGLD